jgi:2-methylcitrate dehydratase PrpD
MRLCVLWTQPEAMATLPSSVATSVAPLDAAFLDALASTVHTFDDTHLRSVIHPTGPVACALFALINRRKTPTSAAELLTALAVGMEISCRLGRVLTEAPAKAHVGTFLTGITCGVGAAAACGHLLKLDPDAMASALGSAVQHACGTRGAHGTHGGSLAPAIGARSGLYSALLAATGLRTGTHGLDGPYGLTQVFGTVDPDAILDGLGERHELLDVAIKPYPCGVVIHPVIDAGLGVYGRIAPDDIDRIDIKAHPLVVQLTGVRHPPNGFSAKASVHHWLAVALIHGTAGLDDATDMRVSERAIAALRDRIFVHTDEPIRSDETKVTIRLLSGEQHIIHVEHATGSVQRPMTTDQVRMKFMTQAVPVIGQGAAEALAELCLALPDVPHTLSQFFDLLRPQSNAASRSGVA